MTVWSPQQERALLAVRRWFSAGYNPEQPFYYLGGYAGTGKTTLAKEMASGIEGRVEFVAYTGKAALVLRQKGCEGARTIHNLIYRVTGNPGVEGAGKLVQLNKELESKIAEYREKSATRDTTKTSEKPGGVNFAFLITPAGKALRIEIDKLEAEIAALKANADRQPGFAVSDTSDANRAKLIIADECSMIDQRVGADLCGFKVPILVLGDPAQLPPVRGGGYFTAGQPDFLLTEVHRQAQNSGILRLATKVREGGRPTLADRAEDTSIVLASNKEHVQAHAMESDQILVGRNKTRHATNKRVRELLKHLGAVPIPGDRMVSLRNDHDIGLLNGSLWECVTCKGDVTDDVLALTMSSLDEDRGNLDITAHTAYFLGKGDTVEAYKRRDAQEIDYGYALTVHKSQGSQWPSVCVIDESQSFGESHRHLYTAITRAADKLAVVI